MHNKTIAKLNEVECFFRDKDDIVMAGDSAAKKAMCEAWVATNMQPTHKKPWCWLKSHHAQKGFVPRAQACFVSAQCRESVPASEFPCPKGLWL